MITSYEVSISDGVVRAATSIGALCGFHPDHSGCDETAFRQQVINLTTRGEFVCLGGMLMLLPPKPTAAHTWSWQTGSWVVDINDLRRLRRDEVNAWRNDREFSPFVSGGMLFDADADAQRRLQLAALSAQQSVMDGVIPEPTIDWTLADNTTITLTATQLLAAAQAMGSSINAAHQAARTLKMQIEAASTAEQLMAIEIA